MIVFISHASADATIAKRLEDLIAHEGYRSWRFQRDMMGANPADPQLPSNIEASDIFLYCISEHSQKSQTCQKELQHATLLQKPLVTVRLNRRISVPSPLSDHQWVQFDDTQEAAIKLMQAIRSAQPLRWDKIHDDWKTWDGRSKYELSTMETVTKKIPLPRMRRDLTDFEKEEFLHKALREIREYFSQALSEFERSDPRIQTRIRDESDTAFKCIIFLDGDIKQSCAIWKSDSLGVQSIAYNEEYGRVIDLNRNAFNTLVQVAELEGSPALEFILDLGMFSQPEDCHICTIDKAAECLWRYFTRTLNEDSSFW